MIYLHPIQVLRAVLVISSADSNKSLYKLSPFVLGKALFAQTGKLKTIKRLQRGDILVERDSHIYSSKLQQLSELGVEPVKVTPHRSLSTCKGAEDPGSHRCHNHSISAVVLTVCKGHHRYV